MKSTRAGSQHTPRSIVQALRLSLVLLFLASCQVAFGDFEFDLSKLAVSCQSSAVRCKDGKIQTCVNGNEWQLVADCGSPDRCNLNRLTCEPCQPGSYQCNEAQPQTCDTDLKWSAATPLPCASAALCRVADDASSASCAPSGCPAEGELQCVGDHLQRCPASLVAWEDVELCASATLCSVEAAKAQVAAHGFPTCLVPTCSPGQFNCDTGSPRPCNAARNGWGDALTTCNGTCNVARGDCSACTPGAYTCSGQELSHCTAEQTWDHEACTSVLSCNSAAETPACDPLICTPGEFRCNDELSTLERCRSDGGKWESVEQCINRRLCNPKATRCEVPSCTDAGATRCKGDEFQVCCENLTHWDLTTLCSPTGSCDPVNGCLPTPCTEGTYRCNDVALELCIQSTWTRTSTCATTVLCDAAQRHCIPPTCAPGERQCVGAILQRCNSAQNGWVEIETCTTKSVCSQETKRCEPG
ncbi:MAG TPA: hypothetical protein VGC79_18075 [Polyangiaceae bacterium]